MRRIVIAAAAFAFASSAAFADDVMASRYGNTTVTTDTSGVQSKIYYAADGTFTGKQGDTNFNGTWKLDASGNVCLAFAQNVPNTPNPICVPIAAHKVGETWQSGGRTVSLVQGIQ